MHFKFRKYALIILLTTTLSINLDLPKLNFLLNSNLAASAQTPDVRKAEADKLLQQGIQQYQTSQFQAALQSWQQALNIYREIKDRKGEGQSLGSLGLAYQSLGDYPKAIEYQQQSLAIAREIKDRLGEGAALGNLGNAYYSLGDYPKAIEYQQQSLAIAREIKDRLGEGQSLGNLGNAYLYLGDYSKAIEYQQQRLAIAREIKDRKGEGAALGNLGLAYLYLRDYSKAIEYQQQLLAIAREIKDRQDEGAALGNLGNAYLYLGDYPKAIKYQQQSLAIAREIKNRQGEGNALGNLGLAYLYLGDYPKAIEYQQQLLAIAREIKDRLGEGISLNNLGLACYKSGNLSAAEKTLYDGIKVWESLRDKKLPDTNKVSLFEQQSRTYRTLQEVLIAQKKTDAALEISERGRARAFVELLSSRLNKDSNKMKSLSAPTISEMKQIAKQHYSTLVQYSVIDDDFQVEGKPTAQESELYIWVIKPNGEVKFHRQDLKPLWQKQNTNLSNLVKSILGTNTRLWKKPLQQLHEILIQPIAQELPKDPNAHVIFIPQASLFFVPFPALKDADNKYLIEKHTILTAPSIQVLDLTHKQRIQTQNISSQNALVVGNPIMPRVAYKPGDKPEQLEALPGAEIEAKEIARLLNTKAIIGKDATKNQILKLLPKARIIHLATHGWADDIRGLGSWIALAPNPTNQQEIGNGLLTAEEILDLKLQAELFVISACETGRGRITGDGVIGLSRSIISAGVPSVLVSLWLVPDEETQLLMTEFYQHLQKNPDKAQALRQAMLDRIKENSLPINWAAFTLIGEA
ncbi:Fis family transcriptional regulator [Nostoc piscinale CENA21]|uniref:Fis family transcriptional regulator n=1 Tax=Nostoc piscinale CENA21 TaxID=224013 RepID=A0A0M4T5Z0_9NOSO|nr:CHAT domain-containing tetratricopeptide repeat protein [Nostoc piscinale]ALF54491.1 Fis family transcriptional regulator [Nostoc piscinale CENA21]